MNKLLLTAAFHSPFGRTGVFLAALCAFGASPANATLQIAFDVGASSFFCADNAACDSNPAVGVLAIGDQTINGVQVNGSIQTALHGSLAVLDTSSLSIINGNAAPVAIAAAVSDTGFFTTSNSVVIGVAGSGTWLNAIGSSTTLGWFVDPLNRQGADFATDTPGVEVGSFFNAPALPVDSFSDTAKLSFAVPSPFSMTLAASGVLAGEGALISRGQDIAATNVPEPSTWALMALGFGLIGLLARARPRRPARFAA
jgi:hypothetical protein